MTKQMWSNVVKMLSNATHGRVILKQLVIQNYCQFSPATGPNSTNPPQEVYNIIICDLLNQY